MARAPRLSPEHRPALARAAARAKPPKDPLPDAIARINALISTSRAAWLGLLSYLAFIGVTLLGVEDADFFITERQTDLPLIGVSVPTNLFFAIAPALGAMLATYLHLYLVKLWEALAEAPLPDTDPALADRIQPWELADFALSFRKGARTVDTRPLGLLAWIVSLTLAFAATPAVLVAFWWRSMPKHDEVLTVICCGIPLSFAIYSAVSSFLRLRRIMQGNDRPLFPTRRARGGWWAGFLALAVFGWLTTEGTLKAYAEIDEIRILNVSLSFPSYRSRAKDRMLADLRAMSEADLRKHFAGRLALLPPDAENQVGASELRLPETRRNQLTRLAASATEDDIEDEVERRLDSAWWARTWLPDLLVPASLQNVDFAYTPDDWQNTDQARDSFRQTWCKANDLSSTLCGPVPDADATPSDHRIHARKVWCAENLPPVVGETAEQLAARCEAHFGNLDRAFADDWKAARQHQRDALKRRDLTGTDLRRADLTGARMEGADLRAARMEGALLMQARMEGADLFKARMEGAVLIGARMDRSTSLTDATLRGASVRDVDYSSVGLSDDQVNSMFGDGSVTLPPGMDRPPHWPKHELGSSEFQRQWRLWQSDPATYTPP
jgi:uncharacterized protein YjbI with pentapeptide repeats